MQNKKDTVVGGPPELNKRRTIGLIALAAIFVLVVGGVLLYRNDHNRSTSTYKTVNDKIAAENQQSLAIKDYKQYQLSLAFSANGDISRGNYSAAQKTLDTIIKNVPSDKIISQTYRAYWSLYQQKGDVQNRKKYALLTAQKLKAEGQADDAAAFEQDANGS